MRSKYRFIRINKGFTLVELILTLAVISIISLTAFQSMNKDFENKQAMAAGEQIRNIGVGVNNYIVNHYDSISKLENSSGGTQDIGPRTCDPTKLSCEITVQTLSNEGMLPPAFINKNVYGAGYKIIISRKGTSPYWNISSLITTDKPLLVGGSVRYDLLGKAMQEAGVDSGMTRGLATKMDGYKGSWSATQTDYSNINNLGLLGFIAGYGSNSYSAFLRRDGTLPMTGDLNMGTKNIYGAANITASGKGSFGGEVEAGSWIKAKNGYGDVISIGGDAATNDYEIMLGSDKPLTIYGAVAPVQINVNGSLKTSVDLNADGSIAAKGNINAGNWLSAKNQNGDKMMIGGDSTGDYDIVFAPTQSGNNVVGFFSSGSSTPFDFNFRGNVNALNASGTQMGVSMNGTTGDIAASGNLKAKTLLPMSTVLYGSACSNVGAISKDSTGSSLICAVSGKWVKSSSVIEVFNQDLSASLPILTTGLVSYCSTTSQQQYTITLNPIQDEMFSTAFTASLTPPSAANAPTSGSDYDRRISLVRTGTGCVLVNDVVCTAQSNIEAGRTGSMSCIRELKAGQSYTVKYVLGNNTEVSMKSSRFLVQYSRVPM